MMGLKRAKGERVRARSSGEGKPPAKPPVEAEPFVPRDTTKIVGMETERNAIAVTMKRGIPTILVGHTGVAKTKLIQRAHEEAKWPYRSVSGRESVEVDNLIGKWRIGTGGTMEYHLGILPFCMKHGIAIGIQEINYIVPEVLVLLHEFLDEGFITLDELSPDDDDFIVRPHENFRLYGTMNPPELYPGARELSPALLRRCIVRHVEPLGPKDEHKVLREQVPHLPREVINQMLAVGQSVREQFNNGQSLFWLSTADLVMWGQLCEDMSPFDAAELAIIGKAPESEAAFVRGRVRLSFDPRKKMSIPVATP